MLLIRDKRRNIHPSYELTETSVPYTQLHLNIIQAIHPVSNWMSPSDKIRSWRKCLADIYEKENGPLQDPVPTFGAALVTAPPSPVLSSSIAGPDPVFLEQLHHSISAIGPCSYPKCLRMSHPVYDPEDSESDSDEGDAAPWSSHSYTSRLLKKASMNLHGGGLRRRKRKCALEEDDQESELDAQYRKRSSRIAKLKSASISSQSPVSRPRQQARRSEQQQSTYSPPPNSAARSQSGRQPSNRYGSISPVISC
ncbi:hypothetical protein F66182_7709 [Fusarium sp. NRRL 66182]|nr:hypothetical protein F66182_7709 [Fusarium sp. NRRL 66182]